MAKISVTVLNQKHVATMTGAQETKITQAAGKKHGYAVNVPNPAFNMALPADPTTNPQLITNPESLGDFLAKKVLNEFFLDGAKNIVVQEKLTVKQAIANAEAVSETNTELAAITVSEEAP